MTSRTTDEIESVELTRPVVERFARDHLHRRPVLLTGAAAWLPALSAWSVAALAETFPAEPFPCYETRGGHPISTHKDLTGVVRESAMTVAAFAARAAGPGEWRAQLRLRLSDPHVRERLEPDLRYPAGLFETPANPEVTAVWLASPGSRTPVHRDGGDGLLGQIAGHKRAHLFPPEADPLVLERIAAIRSFPGTYEEYAATCDDPLPCLAATLSPGDVLYIPRGWFHDIDSPGLSASLVLRN
ncbi:cupin-like domain-containing protein [Actinomadura sp. ATCC 31491]|uniref:Cupin-like domain-containing protein n=1 Tax=Actinomadura luzonensis TaxID=2805427 RepID=A0ABT0FST5_9ACTN|nr:cupin-like domain-containing protein [Actinomadura luzonensis]MCK2215377.1 cupin-like domain-containing protein [Actinomadura luzonensis]